MEQGQCSRSQDAHSSKEVTNLQLYFRTQLSTSAIPDHPELDPPNSKLPVSSEEGLFPEFHYRGLLVMKRGVNQ